jgi:hypothetical protein
MHSGRIRTAAMRNPAKRLFRRSVRNEDGAVAVEFAMIAPMFFALTFAIFETGLTFFANMTLENGVMESARLIRTGQAQAQGITQVQFRDILCEQVEVLLSCDPEDLLIDVRAFSSFGGAGYEDEFDSEGNVNDELDGYDLGQSGASGGADIVLVRAFYKWPLYTPGFSQYFSNMPNGEQYRLISSSVAFRNEPF